MISFAIISLSLVSACRLNQPDNSLNLSGNTDASEMELKVHKLVNDYRISTGLEPLILNQNMIDVARDHSGNMATGTVPFSHEGFDERGEFIMTQLNAVQVAENVAYNYGYTNPGETAVEGWVESSGHRENMEGNYNYTGIGIIQNSENYYYFTQLFALIPE